MALGLIVGIAALGVIAFRSVVERRQEIGMMRAIGFQQIVRVAAVIGEHAMGDGCGHTYNEGMLPGVGRPSM